MWVLMLLGGLWGGWYLDAQCFAQLSRSWLFHLSMFLLGLILLAAVLSVSRHTGRTLARYGREGDLPRLQTNVLVTVGPYKLMRHPMHLGLLFLPLSIALLFGSPSFIFCIAPAEIVMMFLLIKRFEEPEAIKKFGDSYRKYQENTPMFCLKISCIQALLGLK
jgi:protein-S-isoprenylcysteine O-methyltransferase Ste14